ncbi:MAG TPA: serine hydrolase [Patescibacteria group bacterium]|nr:serine hydrolase [Patescibacteria group bacterium]
MYRRLLPSFMLISLLTWVAPIQVFAAVKSNSVPKKTVPMVQQKPGAEPFVPYPNEFASAVIMVPKTHQLLYSFKPDHSRVAASLTKLANALAFIHARTMSWNKVVSLKKVDEVGGGRLRVKVGARLTVIDLLYSSITASANNAATALARITQIGNMAFLKRMNQEVRLAGALRSRFVDTSGMDPKNISTARDIARIAEAAFKDPIIQKAASADAYTFSILNTGEKKTIKSTSLPLINDPDIDLIGGKTGYLLESKNNLVVEVRPANEDKATAVKKDLIVVVMGAETKEGMFATAKRMAEWAWQNHEF